MRKALCVGIDSYEKINNLYGCVNDASLVKRPLREMGMDLLISMFVFAQQ